jgi:hypothetical protein
VFKLFLRVEIAVAYVELLNLLINLEDLLLRVADLEPQIALSPD